MKVAEVKKVLIHKGVTELFHVNSVITSLTFIDNGGLLSYSGSVVKTKI